MALIRPFPAWRYNPARVNWENVLTQPYDKITPEMQQRYYAADSHNLIHIEKGCEFPEDSAQSNVYTRAAGKLAEWTRDGILKQDLTPAIYAYAQEFSVPGTQTRRTRRGFIALARLEDYEAGVVHRHEQTHAGPKADRIELLRHTRAQTGQLFILYPDPRREVEAMFEPALRAAPDTELRDEYGVAHRLWRIEDASLLATLVARMADKPLVIADGHHRYETALAFRNEQRAAATRSGAAPDPDAPYEYTMMTFVGAACDGLVILPTHRLLRGLASFDFEAFREAVRPHFDWYAYPWRSEGEREESLKNFRKDLAARGRDRRAIGAFAGGETLYLFLLRQDANLGALLPDVSPAQRQLDVVLLHRLLLEGAAGVAGDAASRERHLLYERDLEQAVAQVERGEAQAAFFLNPVGVEQVMDLALAGEVLPQKSTDFYPKMLSGVAIYRM